MGAVGVQRASETIEHMDSPVHFTQESLAVFVDAIKNVMSIG
jgi:hypothetical protein